MIRRPPRSTLFPYNDALPISSITIPGYMVWVAVGYAGIGSGLTWLVGRPLIRLNTERYAREADLRFALVRVKDRKSTRLNSSHANISYAVFCLKKKKYTILFP